jgi:hypothetical protein
VPAAPELGLAHGELLVADHAAVGQRGQIAAPALAAPPRRPEGEVKRACTVGYSMDETFDIGWEKGSPGDHPEHEQRHEANFAHAHDSAVTDRPASPHR